MGLNSYKSFHGNMFVKLTGQQTQKLKEHVEGKRATDGMVCEVTGKSMMPGVRTIEVRDGNENRAGSVVDKEDGIERALELAVVGGVSRLDTPYQPSHCLVVFGTGFHSRYMFCRIATQSNHQHPPRACLCVFP
jgi:hypothetical protein